MGGIHNPPGPNPLIKDCEFVTFVTYWREYRARRVALDMRDPSRMMNARFNTRNREA